MAHNINGIITSFKYEGELPSINLISNYHMIPFNSIEGENYTDDRIPPYGELTEEIRRKMKELSFIGKCAYIETSYFGGIGAQISEVWENGKRIEGPLISYDGIRNQNNGENVVIVEGSINQALKNIGIVRHEHKDEFDTIGLGKYRSNKKILEEYKSQIKK